MRPRAPTPPAAIAAALGLAASAIGAPNHAAGQSAAARPQPAEQFETGNLLYQERDYQGALDAYLAVYEAGLESGALHYNLGNAYYKLGQLGPAILHYERARAELPRNEDLLANLELARSLTADQITPLPRFWLSRAVGWLSGLVPSGWLMAIAALAYFSLAAALLLGLLSRKPPPWTRPAAVTAAVLAAGFGANLALREFGIGRAERGVVLAPEAAVQSAPSPDPSLQLFTIHEGTVVRIDRRAEAWLEIVLEDGKVGWLRADALEGI